MVHPKKPAKKILFSDVDALALASENLPAIVKPPPEYGTSRQVVDRIYVRLTFLMEERNYDYSDLADYLESGLGIKLTPITVRKYMNNIYGEQVLPAIFSEDREYEDAPDAVFDIALKTPVIVDLPAQAHRPLSLWLKSKGLLDLGQANGVRFLKWFVCDGGLDSIHLFLESVKYYGDRMPHTLVKNLGRSENWSALESSKAVQSAIVTYGIKTIEFPRLSPHKFLVQDKKVESP